jgi:hypothetical protein
LKTLVDVSLDSGIVFTLQPPGLISCSYDPLSRLAIMTGFSRPSRRCLWNLGASGRQFVEKSKIKANAEYAVREKRVTAAPFQRVRIVEHIRGNKWKAEWIEPNPGLIDYVESSQMIVPWKEHKAYLKEEEDATRLQDHNHRVGYPNVASSHLSCKAGPGGRIDVK